MAKQDDMTDQATGPERKCIATGEVRPISELIRFVVSPDDSIVPDIGGKLPGRGIWVSADRAALEKAVNKNLFPRAAKTQVRVPEDLVAQVDRLMARRLIDLISLARKSGDAIAGFEKVKEWLDRGRARVLLQASDGSDRGKGKLWTPTGARWVGWLTQDELGMAFGRQSVVHAALGSGGLRGKVVEEAARLKGLRVNPDQQTRERDGGRGRPKGKDS
ncbi:RNA-binding protein [Mesobacterium pallidum]|uniref:RNA-binding protein n=1 Tax=Mesobacterium pallidum TaxID=2872037 RepID=UPI001EE29DCA|nr:RNA-binding protein [Mesobacterium pallidum]